MIEVRQAQNEQDLFEIRQVNREAFPDTGGAKAFYEIRQTVTDIVSLVAVDDGTLIGHVLFCPATIATESSEVCGMGLGELAVLPQFQRQGVGTMLTNAGLGILRKRNCPFVIVVGHATYYPRFGFRPGSQLELACQWKNIPDESFMALILDQDAMDGVGGVSCFVGIP